MPQSVKSGKLYSGLSIIARDGAVVVPSGAMQQFSLYRGDKVILKNGNHTSCVFIIDSKSKNKTPKILLIFQTSPCVLQYKLTDGKTSKNRATSTFWPPANSEGDIALPAKTLSAYDTRHHDTLVIIRGSDFELAFFARGPIWDFAVNHPAFKGSQEV